VKERAPSLAVWQPARTETVYPPGEAPLSRAAGEGPGEGAAARYPLAFSLPYPERQGRLTVAFRLPLAFPHQGILGVLGMAVGVTSLIAWVAILVRGRYPAGLWRFGAAYLRREAAVWAYLALLRDEYPSVAPGPYVGTFTLQRPVRYGRLGVVFRPLLVLPGMFAWGLAAYVWLLVLLMAWCALVATGRHPLGLWRFGQGIARWRLRLQAYALLLTDRAPPFSLGSEETPGMEGEPGSTFRLRGSPSTWEPSALNLDR
jgi:hypothetical protein